MILKLITFLSIHINSSKDVSVRGVEVWQYSNSDSNLNNFSNNLCKDVAKIFNIRNRGVKFNKEFSVLKDTKMPACLIEIDFISNSSAESDLNNPANIKLVARAVVTNLVSLYNLETSNTVLYKVCIGAYKSKSNALNQVSIAKERGFKDAYII